jgi:hypothetical protein
VYKRQGLTQPEWRPLMAFFAQLGGRAGRFTWSPPFPRRASGAAARTNHAWNGDFAGAGVGNPGAGWTLAPSNGITPSVTGAGVDVDGARYIDLRMTGTPTLTGVVALMHETARNPAAASAQVWTAAATLQIIGTPTGLGALSWHAAEWAGGALVGTQAVFPTNASLASALRVSATRTMGATATAAGAYLGAAVTVGVPVDATARIKRVQLERAAAASAFIPTTAGAVSVIEGPFVNGAGQTGASLALRGFQPLAQAFLAGDLLSWVDGAGRARLHMATADVTATEAGACTLPIAPPLRSPPMDGATVLIAAPAGVFRLAGDRNPMDLVRGLIGGGTLEIEEALT